MSMMPIVWFCLLASRFPYHQARSRMVCRAWSPLASCRRMAGLARGLRRGIVRFHPQTGLGFRRPGPTRYSAKKTTSRDAASAAECDAGGGVSPRTLRCGDSPAHRTRSWQSAVARYREPRLRAGRCGVGRPVGTVEMAATMTSGSLLQRVTTARGSRPIWLAIAHGACRRP